MNDYVLLIDSNGEPYLAHHGIRGQKWGVRRYQNEDGSLTSAGKSRYSTDSATKTSKSLNRIEQENAVLKTKSAIARMKAEKAYQKGKDSKSESYTKRAKEYDDAVKAGEKLTKRLVSDATKRGYSIQSKDVTRYTHAGRQLVAAYAFGIPGALSVAAVDAHRAKTYGDEAGGIVAGKKYKAIRN